MRRTRLSSIGLTATVVMALAMLPVTVRADVKIDKKTFPDEKFRSYLLAQDYGKDGIITDEEIGGITDISVEERNIRSLEGIKVFTALQTLYCWNNQLTELDVSECKALETLACHHNKLAELNVSANSLLESLTCNGNQLTGFDVSANTALWYLDCDGNQLTELDVSANSELEYLDCSDNQLTELDVSGNTALTDLLCNGNQLTELDVSGNTALQTLHCFYNEIRGKAMDALIEGLNERDETDEGYFVVYYQAEDDEPAEANVFTKEQMAIVKAKNWIVQYAYKNEDSTEYDYLKN